MDWLRIASKKQHDEAQNPEKVTNNQISNYGKKSGMAEV
jgi:hypothetical protein